MLHLILHPGITYCEVETQYKMKDVTPLYDWNTANNMVESQYKIKDTYGK